MTQCKYINHLKTSKMTEKQLKQGQKLKAEIEKIQETVNALKMAGSEFWNLKKAELNIDAFHKTNLSGKTATINLSQEAIALLLPFYTDLLESKKTEFTKI